MHLSLKAKFGVLTGATILAVAVLLTTVLTLQQERTIRQELLARAIALTENLAYNCQLPLAAENQQSLHRLAQGLFKQSEVAYVRFKNSKGVELHSEAVVKGWPFETVEVRDQAAHASGTQTAWATAADGRTFLDVQTAVVVEAGAQEDDILALQRQEDDVMLGTVNVGLSTQPAQALIARVRRLGSLLGIAVALAGSLLATTFIRAITRPLGQLMEGNRRVARGDFGLRLAVHSRDEFGRLASSYNQMADEIQRSRELAESYHASLRANAEHLEVTNRALQQSNADLAKASRMKSEFLAVTSHELRTPLNVIIGFSEVLLDQSFGALNAKQRHYVGNVLTSGRHLLTIINDILDLSKIEAGRMKVAPEPFDLRQLADELQGLVRDLAEKKGVAIRFARTPAETPLTDQKLLRQVMLNLLSNAIKFTPEGGGVELTIRCLDGQDLRGDAAARSLSLERRLAIPARPVLMVEVKDTGVGIASEEHERIFVAFQQVDASYSRQQEGTGLGLALTRKVVRLLGGDIWFTSAPGEGSTFWFYVPFEYQPTEADRESQALSAGYSPSWGGASLAMPGDRAGAAAEDEAVLAAEAAAAEGTEPASRQEQEVSMFGDWPWGGDVSEVAAGAAGVEAAGEPNGIPAEAGPEDTGAEPQVGLEQGVVPAEAPPEPAAASAAEPPEPSTAVAEAPPEPAVVPAGAPPEPAVAVAKPPLEPAVTPADARPAPAIGIEVAPPEPVPVPVEVEAVVAVSRPSRKTASRPRGGKKTRKARTAPPAASEDAT